MKRFIYCIMAILIATPALFAGRLDFDYEGAVLERKNGEKDIYKKKDGTVINRYKDREVALLKDGTRIIRHSDGKREVFQPNGTKVFIEADGTARFLYAGGREEFISMDGKTPYGTEVKEEKKLITSGDSSVEILYSKEFSDDNLNTHSKNFFDEIALQTAKWFKSHKAPDSKIRVVISNCRFCLTGYCKRKNKQEWAIVIYHGEKKQGSLSYSYDEVLNKKEHEALAAKVVREIFRGK